MRTRMIGTVALLVVGIAIPTGWTHADEISNSLDTTIDSAAESMALLFPGSPATTTLYVNAIERRRQERLQLDGLDNPRRRCELEFTLGRDGLAITRDIRLLRRCENAHGDARWSWHDNDQRQPGLEQLWWDVQLLARNLQRDRDARGQHPAGHHEGGDGHAGVQRVVHLQPNGDMDGHRPPIDARHRFRLRRPDIQHRDRWDRFGVHGSQRRWIRH